MIFDIKKVQITVTVPFSYVNTVREAVWDLGVGVIGNYSHCSLASKVVGTFKPNDAAQPFIGKKGEIERVEEAQIEIGCKIEDVKKVVEAIKKVHPYEQPAINIVPLLDEQDFE